MTHTPPTPQSPQEHAAQIASRFCMDHREKYQKGQTEHGGLLHKKRVIEKLWEEVLDFVSYSDVIMRQWQQIDTITEKALKDGSDQAAQLALQAILNIVRIGNPEGIQEEER